MSADRPRSLSLGIDERTAYRFDFYWSPEGRKVETLYAASPSMLPKVKSEFKRLYRRTYGRYMGEVYIRVFHVSDNSEVFPEDK